MHATYPNATYEYEEELITKEELYLENIGKLNREIKQAEDEIR